MVKSLIFTFVVFGTYAGAQEKLTVPIQQKVIDIFTHSRPWRPPNYLNQEQQLGWEKTTFDTPLGMEKAVQFWIDIYTKYSTEQGVLHDADHVDFIFDTIDFSSITNSPMLSPIQKEHAKEKMIKNAKDRLFAIFSKLDSTSFSFSLTEQEQRIWNYYKDEKGDGKFKRIKDEGRLRFQLGQSDRMAQAIFLSGRYLEQMEEIFKEKGLPIELTRLPFVESSFNVFARSKVGASGLWQVMKATGRGKVKINNAIDVRNHPIDATRLAARVLRDNYNMLESWPLAVTGYNHGPSGVRRISERNQSRNIAELVKLDETSRSFGFASRNFFASFLAAVHVEKNALKYFPNVTWSQPLEVTEFKLPKAIYWKDILRWFENDDRKAQLFNPHILTLARKNRIAIPEGTTIGVPMGKVESVMNEFLPKKKDKLIIRK